MPDHTDISVFDAIRALAFIGDLSMGQPTDHSLRTAWLAAAIAQAAGCEAAQVEAARNVALLRWSGCTANAQAVADFLGDDVLGRQAMVASPKLPLRDANRPTPLPGGVLSMASIHCEIAGDVARLLGLGTDVETALRSIFEAYDGGGVPGLLHGNEVPFTTGIVSLASDLEVFGRLYGPGDALALVRARANLLYPGFLVDAALPLAAEWLAGLDSPAEPWANVAEQPEAMHRRIGLELVGDVVDLKLPWMTGYSRRVAALARDCAQRAGLDELARRRVYKAGLIHGIGRAAVPNFILNAAEPLPASSLERLRLVPYWTGRAARHIDGLTAEAELASFTFERRNGSGYFRGHSGAGMPLEGQIVAVAEQWVSHRTRRPWRPALTEAQALDRMHEDTQAGCFDQEVAAALLACVSGHVSPSVSPHDAAAAVRATPKDPSLSERELEVLRCISLGESTKQIARSLDIGPRTVRTHVERIFIKLDCSTRAAATLKASTRGLI